MLACFSFSKASIFAFKPLIKQRPFWVWIIAFYGDKFLWVFCSVEQKISELRNFSAACVTFLCR